MSTLSQRIFTAWRPKPPPAIDTPTNPSPHLWPLPEEIRQRSHSDAAHENLPPRHRASTGQQVKRQLQPTTLKYNRTDDRFARKKVRLSVRRLLKVTTPYFPLIRRTQHDFHAFRFQQRRDLRLRSTDHRNWRHLHGNNAGRTTRLRGDRESLIKEKLRKIKLSN